MNLGQSRFAQLMDHLSHARVSQVRAALRRQPSGTKFFLLGPSNPARVWAQLAAELEVEVVPGDHLNIVTSQFEPSAALLTRHVKRVTSGDYQPTR